MIRRLTEEDRQITLDFLKQEPEINLFAIGDIERFGFDAAFQTLWGDFEAGTDRLQAVLLRYEVNYIPYYAHPNYHPQVFAGVVLSDPQFRMLSGRQPMVQRLLEDLLKVAPQLGQPELDFLEKSTYFCKLTTPDQLEPYDPQVKLASPEDARPAPPRCRPPADARQAGLASEHRPDCAG